MQSAEELRQLHDSRHWPACLALLLALCSPLWANEAAKQSSGSERLYFSIVSTISDLDRGEVHEHRFSIGTIENAPARLSTTLGDHGPLDYVLSFTQTEDTDRVLLSIEVIHGQETIAAPRLLFRIDSESDMSIRSMPDTGFGVALDILASRERPDPILRQD